MTKTISITSVAQIRELRTSSHAGKYELCLMANYSIILMIYCRHMVHIVGTVSNARAQKNN